MKSVLIRSFLFAGLAFAVITSIVSAQVPPPDFFVVAVEINGDIQAGAVQFIRRALEKAERENADLFLIQLNTPGGLLKATEEISRLLLDSPVETAVYVHKKGGWAFSAGVYILLSADIAAAHPESSIGAAEPRLFGLEGVEKSDKKITEASVSWIKRLAETGERNAEIAEEFVRNNKVLSGKEAFEQKAIDRTAYSLEDFLEQIGMADSRVVRVEQTAFERLLSFFSTPQIVPILLTIGALGLIFTFRTGEPGVGVFAALALLLGLWGTGAISVSGLGASFLVLGIAFLIAEFFAPEFGVFGVMGAILLAAGIIFFGQEPLASPVLMNALTYFSVGLGVGLAVFFVIVGRLVAKTLRSKPKSGLEALIGAEAVVVEELTPYGRISVDGQDWRAKSSSEERIAAGELVEITGFSGNTLFARKKAKTIN